MDACDSSDLFDADFGVVTGRSNEKSNSPPGVFGCRRRGRVICPDARRRGTGPPKVARIGWLTAQREASVAPYLKAFREGLADLGYEEGRNITFEFRYGDDDAARVPELASELVKLPVDLIVGQGEAVGIIGQLNLPVPILYVFSADPVASGFADSLARPHANMTGLTLMAAELNAKRLELLKDFKPDLRRVAVLANTLHPGETLEHANVDAAAHELGLTVDYHQTRTRDELNAAFATIDKDPPDAISVFSDGFAVQNRQSIVDFATAHRLPLISGWRIFAQTGALCTYGPRLAEPYRRLAAYVDRVLKGTKPADLPVEQPTKFELVINMRTAKALGLTVSPQLLVRADEVIE